MILKSLFVYGSLALCFVSTGMGAETAKVTNSWSGSVSGGANLTRGNSENMIYNGSVLVEYKVPKHEFKLGAEVNYGENEVVQTNGTRTTQNNVNNAKGFSEYKWLFIGNAYAYAQVELSQDEIADIDYRLLAGPGLGFYIIKNDQQKLSFETGCSYLREKTSDGTDDKLTLRVAQRYELKINDTAKVWEAIEYLPSLEEFADYLLNSEIGIETAIISAFNLKVTVQNKYNSRPADAKKCNDLTAIAAVSYKF